MVNLNFKLLFILIIICGGWTVLSKENVSTKEKALTKEKTPTKEKVLSKEKAPTKEKIPPKGGTIRLQLSTYPSSFNTHTRGDGYTSMLAYFVVEPLVERSNVDYKLVPRLAERWKISKDKKVYTFYLNKKAKFFDGKPVTAHDVKFIFDKIYDPKCVFCQADREYIGPLEYVKIVNKHTIQFKVKNIHFDNIYKIGGMDIFPKHIYNIKGKNFDKDFEKIMVGSGPYTIQVSKDRKNITLLRNKKWWGNDPGVLLYHKKFFNFDKIIFKYINDDTVAFEMFKKKKLDAIYISSDLYSKWDNAKMYPWKDKRCKRIKTPQNFPHEWRGIALNSRIAPTNEKKFRRVLQHLLNRSLIIKKVFKNKKRPLTGPFASGSPYSANLKPIAYDPKKAIALLKELGYAKIGSDGILYKMVKKEGKSIKQRAAIEVIHAWEGHNKWLTIYKEDARKVGVEVKIKMLEWTSLTKLLDEFNFEGLVLGWLAGIVPNPEQYFLSKTVNIKGSSNFSGTNNPKIDALINRGISIFNGDKRYKLYRQLETLIMDEQPYVFTYGDDAHRVGYWAHKVNPSSRPFDKYTGDELRHPFFAHWYTVKK